MPLPPHITTHTVARTLRLCGILFVLFFGATGTAQAAPIVFNVTVNTSSLPANTNGFLSFQFNGGGATAQAATATILNFASNGVLAATSDNTGGASGTLPGQLVINNSSVNPNEVFQGFTFGTTLNFTVALSGAAVDNPAGGVFGSAFTLFLFDANGNSLLTTNANGVLLSIQLNPNGTTGVQTFGSSPGVVSVAQVQAVPEPATMLLLGTGLAGIIGIRRRRVHNQ